ncbi:MAG TPA: ribosome-associated translation inhibitor RaiA [Candidatus Paceibacterota bacterium]
MNYNIKGTALQVTDELRTYVERQLAHADKLIHDSAAHADVELAFDEMRDGPKFKAEFTVECHGKIHRTETWGMSLHEAIDLAGAELVAELRKAKSKNLHVFRHTAVKVKEYLRGWRNSV